MSHQQSRDIVMKQDLNLLIEMLKRETDVAMRTHFEHFKAETDAALVKKADLIQVKSQLQGKVSTNEFWKEIEYVKSMIHTMTRELAVAGITSQQAASGGKRAVGPDTGALRTMIKAEIDKRVIGQDADLIANTAKADADHEEEDDMIAGE